MEYVASVLVVLAPIVIAAFLIHKNIVTYSDISSIGTYLQGVAAILLVAIGLVKTDEVITGINNLKDSLKSARDAVEKIHLSLERIEKISNDTFKKVMTIEISDKRNTSSSSPSNTMELRKDWYEKLAPIPTEKSNGYDIYIPNKEKLIDELVNVDDELDGTIKKAVILQKAIKINEANLPMDKNISTEVKATKDNRLEVIIYKTPKL